MQQTCTSSVRGQVYWEPATGGRSFHLGRSYSYSYAFEVHERLLTVHILF